MQGNEVDNGKILAKKQAKMHKDFFDKCSLAIEDGFYLEAVFLEYAAIEGRLEILCGVIGLPCNKDRDDNVRKSIQISHRINCLDKLRKQHMIFQSSKLERNYFKNLGNWINDRNRFVHGLYKNVIEYSPRMNYCKQLAVTGMKYSRLLYNEVNRMKRLNKKHNDLFAVGVECFSSKCVENLKIGKQQIFYEKESLKEITTIKSLEEKVNLLQKEHMENVVAYENSNVDRDYGEILLDTTCQIKIINQLIQKNVSVDKLRDEIAKLYDFMNVELEERTKYGNL